MSRAQTFTLLACMIWGALFVLALASGSKALRALTVGETVETPSKSELLIVSDAWADQRFGQHAACRVVGYSTRKRCSFAYALNVHLSRSSSLPEGPCGRASSEAPFGRLQAHALSS